MSIRIPSLTHEYREMLKQHAKCAESEALIEQERLKHRRATSIDGECIEVPECKRLARST